MSIEAMKQALEALEKNYVLINGTERFLGLDQIKDTYYAECFDVDGINKQTNDAITALRTAIEQAEKPVAWRWTALVNGEFVSNWVLTHSDPPPYAIESMPLYTAPRQWVGLADDEIKEIIGPWGETTIKGYTRKLFDQIEAKLRAKNT